MNTNPIPLIPEDGRLTAFPIGRESIYKLYKKAYQCHWVPEEIKISDDVDHWRRLKDDEKRIIKFVLAFFASSDTLVNVNIAKRFKEEIPIIEVGWFYDLQMHIENVHSLTYSVLLHAIIDDRAEIERLTTDMQKIPAISNMIKYIEACIESDRPFAERVLRMACVEGIFFSGMFLFIYWIGQRGLMTGLVQSNELIARDEGLHTIFALVLYTMIRPEMQLPADKIVVIFKEAVEIAMQFMKEAVSDTLPQLSQVNIRNYIQNHADGLLSLIDQPAIYNSVNPFDFMKKKDMANRSNFFEVRSTEYGKVNSTDNGDVADDY